MKCLEVGIGHETPRSTPVAVQAPGLSNPDEALGASRVAGGSEAHDDRGAPGGLRRANEQPKQRSRMKNLPVGTVVKFKKHDNSEGVATITGYDIHFTKYKAVKHSFDGVPMPTVTLWLFDNEVIGTATERK